MKLAVERREVAISVSTLQANGKDKSLELVLLRLQLNALVCMNKNSNV